MLPFCVIKTSAELEAIKCTVSPFNSPACFVSLTAASLSNAFIVAQDSVNQIHSSCLCVTEGETRQQNGAVTRMWRSCGVQPLHKERVIGAIRCKKGGMLLQPLQWCCVECVIHHERDVRAEQHHTYMWREQAIIEWSWHVNSIVACCPSAKLCAYAARDFRSQQDTCWNPCNETAVVLYFISDKVSTMILCPMKPY